MTECAYTMREFAEKYGIQRVDVNAAVLRADLVPLPEKRHTGHRLAAQYWETDLYRAVRAYCLDKRRYYVNKANGWTRKTNALADQFRKEVGRDV